MAEAGGAEAGIGSPAGADLGQRGGSGPWAGKARDRPAAAGRRPPGPQAAPGSSGPGHPGEP